MLSLLGGRAVVRMEFLSVSEKSRAVLFSIRHNKIEEKCYDEEVLVIRGELVVIR